jgi:hypothetical protein
MKIRAPLHQKGSVPAWPFVGFGLLVLAGLGLFIKLLPERWVPPCGFHVATGHPCPSCGVTRMGFAILSGHLVDAFFYHPFFFLVLGALGLWFGAGLAVRLFWKRDLFFDTTSREDKWLWLLLLLGFLLNWAYLWRAGV